MVQPKLNRSATSFSRSQNGADLHFETDTHKAEACETSVPADSTTTRKVRSLRRVKRALRGARSRLLGRESLETRHMMALDVVADINVQPESSDPSEFVQIGSSSYVVATASPQRGREIKYLIDSPQNPGFLPRSGTFDLYPGPISSDPKEITIFGNSIYFSANTPSSIVTGGGREVWRAREDVVTPLKDIMPGSGSSNPADFTVVGNTLYFTANSPTNGRELWKTDGTPAGTTIVRNINVRPGASSNPKDLVAFQGQLYFTADNGLSGRELWRTDGTFAGTTLVRDIFTGSGSSNPAELTVAGNRLYFAATNAITGREIWSSDGTMGGTTLLRDIDSASSNPEQLTAVGNNLYFTASTPATGRELYRYDPIVFKSVVLVRDIYPGAQSSTPRELTAVGQTLYFVADYQAVGAPPSAAQVWKSGGTRASTLPVQGWNAPIPIASPTELTEVGGVLYFSGHLPTVGDELFSTGGTPASTKMVTNINPGSVSSSPRRLTNVNGKLHFAANDGVNGVEHWGLDAQGKAVLIEDIWRGTGDSSPAAMTVLANEVYFTAFNNQRNALYKHNPTTLAFTQISNDATNVLNSPETLKTAGSSVFYAATANNFQSFELWKTDGTAASSMLLKSISPTSSAYSIQSIQSMTVVGNDIYFTVREVTPTLEQNTQLWRSNGTIAGTVRLLPNAKFHALQELTAVGNRLYFVERKANFEQVLWKSDGNNASTVAVPIATIQFIENLIAKDNELFFYGVSGDNTTTGLYRTNGTTSGTQLVKGSLLINQVTPMIHINGTLYFTAQDNTPMQGYELFKSDGTSAGTIVVKDIFPSVGTTLNQSFPEQFANVNGKLYFSAVTSAGRELWSSDGTDSGTKIVKNIAGSSFSSDPKNLVNVNGKLYFTATNIVGNNDTIRQVMVSDGTNAGTKIIPVLDVSYKGDPNLLTPVGDALYFSAFARKNASDLGVEPMLYKPDAARSSIASAAAVDQIMGSTTSLSGDLSDLDALANARKKNARVRS